MAPQNLSPSSSPPENNHDPDIIEYDDDDDGVSQVLRLIGATVPDPPTNAPDVMENNSIADFFSSLENSEVHELANAKRELQVEKVKRANCEENLAKLVDFITFVHGEFGKLIESLVSMATKGRKGASSVLCLGPFNDGNELNEFLEMLRALSNEFLSEYENLGGTKDLLQKVNAILRAKETATVANNGSSNQTVNNDNDHYDQIENEQPSATTSTSPIVDNTLHPEIVDLIGEIPTGNPPSSIRKRGRPPKRRFVIKTENSLASVNKKHGVDYSKHYLGHYCLCSNKFRSKASLNVHIRYFTAELPFGCHVCPQRFPYPSTRQVHMSKSHKIEKMNGNSITCAICKMQFEMTWKEFQHHLRSIHNHDATSKRRRGRPPKWQINEDGDHQRNNDHGQRNHHQHGLDTSAADPNSCICGNTYSSKSALTFHVNSKLYGKVFKCMYCEKSFSFHVLLKTHVRNDHGMEYSRQNKYACSICGQTFPFLNQVIQHRLIAHNIQRLRKPRRRTSPPPPLLVAENPIRVNDENDLQSSFPPTFPLLVPINDVAGCVGEYEDADGVICID